MPLALEGSLTDVQFRYPAELPLTLSKIEHFETGSSMIMHVRVLIIFAEPDLIRQIFDPDPRPFPALILPDS